MRKAGLVKGEKRGYWTHYCIERDILHGAFSGGNIMSFTLDFCILGGFCFALFTWSLRSIRHKWIQ